MLRKIPLDTWSLSSLIVCNPLPFPPPPLPPFFCSTTAGSGSNHTAVAFSSLKRKKGKNSRRNWKENKEQTRDSYRWIGRRVMGAAHSTMLWKGCEIQQSKSKQWTRATGIQMARDTKCKDESLLCLPENQKRTRSRTFDGWFKELDPNSMMVIYRTIIIE